jgi:ketosteroid isomerase-like protein
MSRQNQAIPRSIVETAMSRSPRNKAVTPPSEAGTTSGRHGASQHTGGDISFGHSSLVVISPATDKLRRRESSENLAPVTSSNWFGRMQLAASHAVAVALGAALMWHMTEKPDYARQSAAPAKTTKATPNAPNPSVIAATEIPVETQIRDTLESWRQSWSNRDVDAYLGFYSANFVPSDGANRAAWSENRRKKLLSQSNIRVRIGDLKIGRLENGQAEVKLLQDYESGHYKETRRPKTFLLKQENGGWRIIQEQQDSQ